MTSPSLLIFAKSPRMGLAKTRLAHDVGRVEAARLNRMCHTRAIACRRGPWRTRLCVAPDLDLHATHGDLWPASLDRRAQGGGDLGARLMRAVLDAPPGPLVLIGTDAPDIAPALIRRAFKALLTHDAVAGPADDGGFWLFGLSHAMRRRPSPFAQVRWSTEHALADVVARLPPKARLCILPTLIDLDDSHALAAWKHTNKP
ncbi:MAG: TIGR04282 family arsenosugar biosynthesis glycosyltransferase [Pseudomonadota bacterium]